MKLISHRGNLNGPDTTTENTEFQINLAISLGYDVEVDVWYVDNTLMLGHDGPTHKTTLEFLQRDSIWAHAKNLQALEYLLNNNVHCFWHENDARVLTSKNFIWTYPKKDTVKNSVIVELSDTLTLVNTDIYGVCGDYVEDWKSAYSSLF
jgi:hypothetical protein